MVAGNSSNDDLHDFSCFIQILNVFMVWAHRVNACSALVVDLSLVVSSQHAT